MQLGGGYGARTTLAPAISCGRGSIADENDLVDTLEWLDSDLRSRRGRLSLRRCNACLRRHCKTRNSEVKPFHASTPWLDVWT